MNKYYEYTTDYVYAYKINLYRKIYHLIKKPFVEISNFTNNLHQICREMPNEKFTEFEIYLINGIF